MGFFNNLNKQDSHALPGIDTLALVHGLSFVSPDAARLDWVGVSNDYPELTLYGTGLTWANVKHGAAWVYFRDGHRPEVRGWLRAGSLFVPVPSRYVSPSEVRQAFGLRDFHDH